MQFMEIGAEMGFAREQLAKALWAAFMNPAGNPELALEYLITEQPQRIDGAMNARAREDVREVVITDTDGDTMIFKLTSDGARVQQWYNGSLEIDDVKHIEVDLETGQVRHCGVPLGRFTIRPEDRQGKMEALSSLLALSIDRASSDESASSLLVEPDDEDDSEVPDLLPSANILESSQHPPSIRAGDSFHSGAPIGIPVFPPNAPPTYWNPSVPTAERIYPAGSAFGGSVCVKKYADRAMKERLEEEEMAGAGADADYTKRTEAKAESEKIKTENLLVVPDRDTIEMSRHNKQTYRKSEVGPSTWTWRSSCSSWKLEQKWGSHRSR